MAKFISRPALLIAALSVFCVGVAEPKQPATPPAQPVTVYDTALAPGWSNWSWAKTELSVEINGSARRPIRVEAGPYQALYLQHPAFPTNGLSKISLLIQGSAPDGEVRLFLLTDGKVNGEGKLIKLANTGWTQVVTPLVTLASEDKLIDGLWIQNAAGNDLPRFYVTDIKIE